MQLNILRVKFYNLKQKNLNPTLSRVFICKYEKDKYSYLYTFLKQRRTKSFNVIQIIDPSNKFRTVEYLYCLGMHF